MRCITAGNGTSDDPSGSQAASIDSSSAEASDAIPSDPSSSVIISDIVSDTSSEAPSSEEPSSIDSDPAETSTSEAVPSEEDSSDAVPSEEEPSDIVSSEPVVSDIVIEPPKTSEKEPTLDLYDYLKDFVVENGHINGDYCYYTNTADTYGGDPSEDFSLYYWGDTNTVEFSLHCPLNETFSVNFYLQIPKNQSTTYTYISSYYYRSDGSALYEAKGTINAAKFTKNYPLTSSSYRGSTDVQNDFMELSRVGICDLLDCLKQFLMVEKLDCSFKKDFGFVKF